MDDFIYSSSSSKTNACWVNTNTLHTCRQQTFMQLYQLHNLITLMQLNQLHNLITFMQLNQLHNLITFMQLNQLCSLITWIESYEMCHFMTITPSFLLWPHLKLFAQNGLIRTPEPIGENGFTLAHIMASLIDIADLPSSRKNAGPCNVEIIDLIIVNTKKVKLHRAKLLQ